MTAYDVRISDWSSDVCSSDLPFAALALTAAIALLGGFARGVTGFGAALATTPLLTLYLPPQVVVPAIVLATTVTNLPFMYRSFRQVDLKAVLFLTLGAAAGLPVGVLPLAVLGTGRASVWERGCPYV